MRNIDILDRECFRGSIARNFRTSPAMAKLLENPKVASVLLDDRRRKEFFDVMWAAVGENGELDSDTLRKILGNLYSGARTVSKGGVRQIADALLPENRDPKYFTYPEQTETKPASQDKVEDIDAGDIEADRGTSERPVIARKRLIDRVLGW